MLRPWNIIVCLVMMCSTIVFTGRPARGAGPDWVFLDENRDSSFFYDPGSAVKDREGIVEVRTRVVYTDQGKADALKILGNQFAKLFETRYLYALDCKTLQSRLLEAQHLNRDGAMMKYTDLSSATEWEEIPGNARLTLVMEKVCGW